MSTADPLSPKHPQQPILKFEFGGRDWPRPPQSSWPQWLLGADTATDEEKQKLVRSILCHSVSTDKGAKGTNLFGGHTKVREKPIHRVGVPGGDRVDFKKICNIFKWHGR
jgi:hypothetical protein